MPAGKSPPSSAEVADPSLDVASVPELLPEEEAPSSVASVPELLPEEEAPSSVASPELPGDDSSPFADVPSTVAPSRSSLDPSVSAPPLLTPLPDPPLPPLDPESLCEPLVQMQGPKPLPSALHTWAPVHPLVPAHETDWPAVQVLAEDPELPQPPRRAKTARTPAVPTHVHFFIDRSLLQRRAGLARSYLNRDSMGTSVSHFTRVRNNMPGE